jgi:hypothetical protein
LGYELKGQNPAIIKIVLIRKDLLRKSETLPSEGVRGNEFEPHKGGPGSRESRVVPIFTTDKISIISSLQGAKAAPSGPIRTNIPAPELIHTWVPRVFVLLRPGGENEGDAEAPLAIIRSNDCPFCWHFAVVRD